MKFTERFSPSAVCSSSKFPKPGQSMQRGNEQTHRQDLVRLKVDSLTLSSKVTKVLGVANPRWTKARAGVKLGQGNAG